MRVCVRVCPVDTVVHPPVECEHAALAAQRLRGLGGQGLNLPAPLETGPVPELSARPLPSEALPLCCPLQEWEVCFCCHGLQGVRNNNPTPATQSLCAGKQLYVNYANIMQAMRSHECCKCPIGQRIILLASCCKNDTTALFGMCCTALN